MRTGRFFSDRSGHSHLGVVDSRLFEAHAKLIEDNEDGEIGISAISRWEVAKLVELGRLVLPVAMDEWFASALGYPGVTLVNLTPDIVIESTRLPDRFHRDPADQLVVATARVLGSDLLTTDQRIRDYPHVKTP